MKHRIFQIHFIQLLVISSLLFGCETTSKTTSTIDSQSIYTRSEESAKKLRASLESQFKNEYKVTVATDFDENRGSPGFISIVTPKLPKEFESSSVTHALSVKAIISAQGEVLEAIVVKSTDDRLNQAAITAIKESQLTPATYKGIPVMCLIELPIWYEH